MARTTTRTARRASPNIPQLPNECVSWEQALQVWNEDVADMTPAHAAAEIQRTMRLLTLHPRGFVFRSGELVPAASWGVDRIRLCWERLKS